MKRNTSVLSPIYVNLAIKFPLKRLLFFLNSLYLLNLLFFYMVSYAVLDNTCYNYPIISIFIFGAKRFIKAETINTYFSLAKTGYRQGVCHG